MLEKITGIKRKVVSGLAAICLLGGAATTGCKTVSDLVPGDSEEVIKTAGPLIGGIIIGYLLGSEKRKYEVLEGGECIKDVKTEDIYCKIEISGWSADSVDSLPYVDTGDGTFYQVNSSTGEESEEDEPVLEESSKVQEEPKQKYQQDGRTYTQPKEYYQKVMTEHGKKK